jgi:hypothetical protein
MDTISRKTRINRIIVSIIKTFGRKRALRNKHFDIIAYVTAVKK